MVEDGKVAATSPLSKPNLLHLMKNCAEMMCLLDREGLPALNLRCFFFFFLTPPGLIKISIKILIKCTRRDKFD